MKLPGIARGALGLAALVVVTPLSAQSRPTAAASTSLEETRNAIGAWVQLRTTISAETADWRVEQELLTARIQLFREELEQLDRSINEFSQSATAADTRRAQLEDESAAARAALAPVEARISGYETRLKAIGEALPVGLRQRLNVALAQLPDRPGQTTRPLAERLSIVVSLMNEIDKFNQSIHLFNENREVPGGQVAQVNALYLGLAQAYAVDATAQNAWVGRPGPQGWQWTPAPEHAATISRAVRMYERSLTPAEYLSLPITIE